MSNIENPKHYQGGDVEAIDALRSMMGSGIEQFYIGNVFKYIWRYKQKNGIEDLKKARVHLDWAIEHLEKEKQNERMD